jgi:S-adenosyl-L-methionine hydrolase (adenosine-forming)
MNLPGIVSLLTDFGHDDEYVGVMKAVILGYSPNARIVDICHNIGPQDVYSAARMLEASYPFFPEGTVHLVVVDPGVGTTRNIIIAETDQHIFIAPDNGILTAILQSSKLGKCYALPDMAATVASSTFHGRDIMAPAAGKILAGTPISTLGDPFDPEHCVVLPPSPVQITDTEITGEIIAIDHFGNIATSIKAEHLRIPHIDVEIEIGGVVISGIVKAYADVEKSAMAALIDSRGNLEIAMNQGNAAKHLGSKRGDSVVLRSASRHSPE